MQRIVGLLEKIRVVKDAPLMVRFTLTTIHKSYSCIVVKPELTTVILMLREGKYNIAAEGHFNQRKQFVVDSFTIRNPDKVTKELGL